MANNTLFKLIKKKIPDLTHAEELLLTTLSEGQILGFRIQGEDSLEPCKVKELPNECAIRASVIAAICTSPAAFEYMHPGGLRLMGARIEGSLDLENVNFPFPLRFHKCLFEQKINLPFARITELEFSGCCTKDINLHGSTVIGRLLLTKGFHAMGMVNLANSIIGDNVDCQGGWFEKSGSYPLIATRMKAGGDVIFNNGFIAIGGIDLYGLELKGNLVCEDCKFENAGGVALDGTAMKVGGSIILRNGFVANGLVRFQGAVVDGSLDCTSGKFENLEGYAIDAERIKVGDAVFFREGFEANGGVRLFGARVGSLECDNGKFIKPEGYAINAEWMKVVGAILFRKGFEVKGEVRLLRTEVGGNFECSNGKFENTGGCAILAERMKIGGSIFMKNGFEAKGDVNLLGAEVDGNLECINGKFENPDGYAIFAAEMKIRGNILLRKAFDAKGEVCFSRVEAGGDLNCDNGRFEKIDGYALNAEMLKVNGNISFQDGFIAEGGVQLSHVEIGKNLIFTDCKLEKKGDIALFAPFMNVKDNILFQNGFEVIGGVVLVGTRVGQNLIFRDSKLSNPGSEVFNCTNCQIDNTFAWSNLREKPVGDIVLENVYTSIFEDEPNSWPDNACIRMDGFQYVSITTETTRNINNRLRWLELQAPGHFSTQPYEQLIKVYRSMGLERQAKQVGIAKQNALRKHGDLDFLSKAWNWILGSFIDHGYSPWKALRLMIVLILLGWVVFDLAFQEGVMTLTKEPITFIERGIKIEIPYYKFNPTVYSIDVLVPFLDLQQESYWLPNNSIPGGQKFLVYYWIHLSLGWFLTTMAVAAFTGIIKKD